MTAWRRFKKGERVTWLADSGERMEGMLERIDASTPAAWVNVGPAGDGSGDRIEIVDLAATTLEKLS